MFRWKTFIFAALLSMCESATVVLDVFYPESQTNSSDGIIFSYAYSTSPYNYELYESMQKVSTNNYQPWLGNSTYYIKDSDKVDSNHWRREVDIGDNTGEVYLFVAAYVDYVAYRTTILVCDSVLIDVADTGTCFPKNSPYKVLVPSVTSKVTLQMYPSFDSLNLKYKGGALNMFENFYSPQLGNYRDIAGKP